jgi:integrase
MGQRAPRTHLSEPPALSLDRLAKLGQSWLLDGQDRRLSPRTLEARQFLIDKLVWFLRDQGATEFTRLEIRQFLAHVNNGHQDGRGRWGNERMTQEVKPRTTLTYFINLKSLCNFLVEEGALPASPMETLRPPVARSDQIKPFTQEQVNALIAAAEKTWPRERNLALVLLLFDTGARASEACSLRVGDFDLPARECVVTGKGNKRRTLPFGRRTVRALYKHLDMSDDPQLPAFPSGRGPGAHQAMTRSGLLQLFAELGKQAGISSVRCSPHTARHTFAIEFLRNDGDIFTLKELLGHTSLTIVNRYLAISQADIKRQHRRCSPVDRLGG